MKPTRADLLRQLNAISKDLQWPGIPKHERDYLTRKYDAVCSQLAKLRTPIRIPR